MTTATHSRLHAAGLRVTAGRVAVLEALNTLPHSSADSVHSAIGAALPSLSIQSVHNVLADLSAAELVRRIEPAHSAARYELRVDDNHHHVVCTSCGAIADVDCVVGHAPCLEPSDAAGFTIATAEVIFWGLCADCAAAPAQSSTT